MSFQTNVVVVTSLLAVLVPIFVLADNRSPFQVQDILDQELLSTATELSVPDELTSCTCHRNLDVEHNLCCTRLTFVFHVSGEAYQLSDNGSKIYPITISYVYKPPFSWRFLKKLTSVLVPADWTPACHRMEVNETLRLIPRTDYLYHGKLPFPSFQLDDCTNVRKFNEMSADELVRLSSMQSHDCEFQMTCW